MSKMARQLQIYDRVSCAPTPEEISFGVIIGPSELIREFGISQRMLQRDLKDLRDCGLISLKYNRARNMYIQSGEPVFDENAGERRRQHLRRLYRLGTLIDNLTRTYCSELDQYESLVQELEDFIEFSKEDPETFTPEDIAELRRKLLDEYPEFPDLKAEYHLLFPDSSERTRQRDFKELREAGFDLYYDPVYRTYIFKEDDTIYY